MNNINRHANTEGGNCTWIPPLDQERQATNDSQEKNN